MPVTGPIPLPGSPGEAFFNGATKTHNIINDILNRRLMAQHQADTLKFNQQQLAETKRYHTGTLGISQQAENRQQSQMPYILQELKDAHNKAVTLLPLFKQQYEDAHNKQMTADQAEKVYQKLVKDRMDAAMNGGQADAKVQAPANMPQIPEAAQQVPAGQQQEESNVEQQPHPNMTPMGLPMLPWMSHTPAVPVEGMTPWAYEKPRNPLADMMENKQFPPMASPTGAAMPMPQQAPQPQGAAAPRVEQTPQQGGAGQPNPAQETVINPGNPKLYGEDAIAGMTIGTHKMAPLPPPHYDANSGTMIQTYPSGKITSIPYRPPGQSGSLASKETSEQKQKRMTETALNIAEGKNTIKYSNDMEKETKNLVSSVNTLLHLNTLLDNHPNLTGARYDVPILGKVAKALSKSDPLGQFESGSGTIQGEIAKNTAGNKTGVGVINWAKMVKPSIGYDPDRNKGFIRQNLVHLKDQFNDNKKDWERKNPGKEFPYKLPKIPIIKNINTTFVDSNGSQHTIPTKNLDKARMIDPGLKVVED